MLLNKKIYAIIAFKNNKDLKKFENNLFLFTIIKKIKIIIQLIIKINQMSRQNFLSKNKRIFKIKNLKYFLINL